MVIFPVYAFEEGDVTIFKSHMVEHALENQDVVRNVYRCFDSEGYCIHLDIWKEQQIPRRMDLCIDEFREKLLQTLRYFDPSVSKDLSLVELQQRVLEVLKDDIYW